MNFILKIFDFKLNFLDYFTMELENNNVVNASNKKPSSNGFQPYVMV